MIVSVSESCQSSDLTAPPASSPQQRHHHAPLSHSPSPRKQQQQQSHSHTRTPSPSPPPHSSAARSPSPDLISMTSSGAPSPAMTPVAGASSAEPQGLDSWGCDRLHGTFQVEDGGIISSHLYSFSLSEPTDIFISLQMAADMSARATKLVDVGFFVAKKPVKLGGEPELVDFVAPQSIATASLRFSGDAGDYLLIPYSSACSLQRRKAHPPTRVPICVKDGDGDWVPSEEAGKAIREIFNRADLDMGGAIGRREYDLYQLYTEGEPCDDDTWAFLAENFDTEAGELTPKGFHDLWGQMLGGMKEECSEEELFEESGFVGLGYNTLLQQDEAAGFVAFVFSEKHNVLQRFEAMPIDKTYAQKMAMLVTLIYGEPDPVTETLKLCTFQAAGREFVSVLAHNESEQPAMVEFDFSESKNASVSATTFKCMVNPGGVAFGGCLMPANPLEQWIPKCTLKIAD